MNLMSDKKRRGGGGKLARTETVQVRLDPRLRYAAELAAGKERRTLSSFVEWAVERAVREIHVTKLKDGQLVTAKQVADELWTEDELARAYQVQTYYPELLTSQERLLLKADTEAGWGHYQRTMRELIKQIDHLTAAGPVAPEVLEVYRLASEIAYAAPYFEKVKAMRPKGETDGT